MTEDTKTGIIRSCVSKGTDVDFVLYENHANDSRITEVKKCPTMSGRMGTGGWNLPIVLSVHQNQAREIQTSDKGFTVGTTGNASGRNTGKIMENNSIRRLTPGECEALQGFPKGYTEIPYKKKDVAACPDGPRYKAIGNSWAVPCARWIGERILKVEAEITEAL